MAEQTFCYVASKPGQPGAYAACSADTDFLKEAGKFASREIRRGAVVTRVPTETARAMLGEWLKWDQEHGERAKKRSGERGGAGK